ncbi:MAG TPA: DUF547 domain-containing protein [Thermoanaerobaculia bacterium]
MFVVAFLLAASCALRAEAQDYSSWNAILAKYYDPAHGFDYAGLKAHDAQTLENLKQQLGRVNVAALNRKEQLAYWINVYNVNTVATIVENYPVKSIRDLSTDPLIFTVFKKKRIPFGGELLSLDDVETAKIREGFHDPRIHFAINCAARSCPPLRFEAYAGERIDAQLDQQARRFLGANTRFTRDGDTLVIHLTKIMDWFGSDFGDKAAFLRRYITVPAAKSIDYAYDDYDWSLNSR